MLGPFGNLVFQRLFCPAVGGDIGIGCHIAATGRRIADDPHDPPVALFAFGAMFAARAHMFDPARDLLLYLGFVKMAFAHIVADQIGNRRANKDQFIGQVEKFLIAVVPCHQLHIAINQCNPLVDILDCDLQQVTAERQAAAGFVEHGHHFGEFDG